MIPQQSQGLTVPPVRAQFEPSRTSQVFAGVLEPVDPRQTRAFGYTVEVAIERQAYDTTICRDDDPAHVDLNACTVDVLWWAKIALDAHPFPQRLPFTVWPADRPINLAAIRGTGDMGEDVITIVAVDPISPFSVKGTDRILPALHHQVFGGRHLTPHVTVSILHVVLAALLDTEQIAGFHVADTPSNPVGVTTTDGRTTVLHYHIDGSYSLGLLAEFCDI